jgi:nitroimidazol reductase NimA-like FMN-containing flavoprotein (pyridoxamine 5'-phosphate oxidase superfamily)
MFGTLKDEQINTLLSQQEVGRIACSDKAFIYVVPISYAYKDGCIYARSFEGMKLEMMRRNPDICFEVDDIRDLANWQSVVAWGTFEELANEERQNGLRILSQRPLHSGAGIKSALGKTWPFSNPDIEDITGVVFKITINKKTGRFERSSVAAPAIG